MSDFEAVIEKIRAEFDSTVELGKSFERLIKNFLLISPTYSFKDVWLWNEFPYRENKDLGIDIVARDQHDDFWAVQCKFYQPNVYIDKPEVDSFLAASSQSFSVDGATKNFIQRIWISTTTCLNSNASKMLNNQNPPVTQIYTSELENAPVDWQKIFEGKLDRNTILRKALRPHQAEAVQNAVEYYKKHDRGKMIMACGTGKTFTSLKIAERLLFPPAHPVESSTLRPESVVPAGNMQAAAFDRKSAVPAGNIEVGGAIAPTVLYLTPSISLLNQTLIEWTNQSEHNINAVCVCSDRTASITQAKKDDTPVDQSILPSTTDPVEIKKRLNSSIPVDGMNVVFSTYQSLDKVAAAYIDFDLIICDEAHRTTGFEEIGKDAPLFKRVHDNNFIRAKKRLYMTATPKLYTIKAKKAANEKDLTLWSMDDKDIFGDDFYVLKFSDALNKHLLTDYRVLVFTALEDAVPNYIKEQSNISDAAKVFGCVNALSKNLSDNSKFILNDDPNPMRSAVAYCSSIALSKHITNIFNQIEPSKDIVNVRADHVDGSMQSEMRKQKLATLKDVHEGDCHILTNARCLSEGIDVPALDAVMFLSSRRSTVDIIQAVGRVMRKAEGKQFGYIILPVVIPKGADPVDELNHNKDFDIVWQVLNALRSHDDKFYIEVNKLALNNNANVID